MISIRRCCVRAIIFNKFFAKWSPRVRVHAERPVRENLSSTAVKVLATLQTPPLPLLPDSSRPASASDRSESKSLVTALLGSLLAQTLSAVRPAAHRTLRGSRPIRQASSRYIRAWSSSGSGSPSRWVFWARVTASWNPPYFAYESQAKAFHQTVKSKPKRFIPKEELLFSARGVISLRTVRFVKTPGPSRDRAPSPAREGHPLGPVALLSRDGSGRDQSSGGS
jgi:hypothetical protein